MHKVSQVSSLHSLLTYHGCSCSSWVYRTESCPLNRRHVRSLGCSAPAATKASLPQSLASLSFRWCLGKKTNKTAGHQPFFFFPPLPFVHPDGFMLYFSTGSEPWFQKGESTILATSEILLSAHVNQLHAVRGHFPWSQIPSPVPPFLPMHIPVRVSRE